MSEKIHVIDISYEDLASDILSEIQVAITDLKFTEINYKKANDTNISFRKIEPYAMYSVGNKWILLAWCYLRSDYRAFRIDRIQHFKILNETYEDRGFNLQDYFQNHPWEGARAFNEKGNHSS